MKVKSTRYKQGSIQLRENVKGSVWRAIGTGCIGQAEGPGNSWIVSGRSRFEPTLG